jgi:hypothetical protein
MERSTGRERMGRRCVATASSTGEQCRKAPVRGATVCATHGGSVGRVKAAAARRVAESAALAVWQRHGNGHEPVDVAAELARLTAEVTAFKDWAGSQLAALTAGEWDALDPGTAATLGLWERALDRAARVLADVARLGLTAHAQSVTEQQAAVLTKALNDLGCPAGHADVRAAVYRRIRMHAPQPSADGRG